MESYAFVLWTQRLEMKTMSHLGFEILVPALGNDAIERPTNSRLHSIFELPYFFHRLCVHGWVPMLPVACAAHGTQEFDTQMFCSADAAIKYLINMVAVNFKYLHCVIFM